MADSVTIKISNPEKILFPEDRLSKSDMVRYYKKVSRIMLPYLKDRPLALERFPNGIKEKAFYQKNAAKYFPRWIKTKKIKKTNYVICNNEATLLYLANLASITLHGWLSRYGQPDFPDKLVIDLDPQKENQLDELAEVARGFKFIFEKLGMRVFLLSTGSRGLHLIIPLDRKANFREARKFALDVAELVQKQSNNLITLEMRKEKRKGRIFVDTYRNSLSQLSVIPYSIRSKNSAPIAVPLSWNELDDFYPKKYTIKNVPRKNPWRDFFKKSYSIKEARKKLDKLVK